MKNFIEITTKDGIEFVNVNHIFKVAPYDKINEVEKCAISFISSDKNGYSTSYSTESYTDIITKINKAN